MNINQPKISVLMPVFNGEKYLREAIQSIIDQTYGNFELLILDDGSTDASVRIAESFTDERIRLIKSETNKGLVDRLNYGIHCARGEYIARMDCDDISLPDRFEKQIKFLDAHPDVGLCGSWVMPFGSTIRRIWRYPVSPEEIHMTLLFRSVFAHPSVMFRKSMLIEHQLQYDPDFFRAEDFALWFRCSKAFKLANLPEVLLKYRVNKGSIVNSNPQVHREAVSRVCRENLRLEGITLSEDEFRIHRLGTLAFDCESQKDLIEFEAWLKELGSYFIHSGKYDYKPETIQRVLGNIWFWVCSRIGTSYGRWTWKTFRRSEYAQYAAITLKESLVFYLKCLKRYKVARG